MASETIFNKDFTENTVFVSKIYPADVQKVWDHLTKAELLDLWWAPKPWKCKTESLDFREDGTWLYSMVGPDGEKHWSKVKYREITEHRSFDGLDSFCDENGNSDPNLPQTQWLIGFTGIEEGTKITFNIHFKTSEDMKKQVEMGFEEGFKMGLNQLEEILSI
ncbi:glutathione S-transferase [Chryseobacterium sp. Leaf404]|uniref:SRPBCC family protein n=1 Tax=unclassified Chryseobacterium TaxID=2593645 RepID=UPI0006FA1741|nr:MULTISPECIES: SRPBCC domain-containing protein [unclassified Chryseobacterium]KQT22063.1 glutathione S-transferase [Chryseobacterium sp. Leaf404]